jgi:hypothetical protein
MKAQGLSVKTVIIAALALIVLIVIVAIFTGRIRFFGSGTRNCETQGGDCRGSCDILTETTMPGTDCADRFGPTSVCCILIT